MQVIKIQIFWKQQPAMSNPLNKFIRKTGDAGGGQRTLTLTTTVRAAFNERRMTTLMDHSVMNKAVRTFNRMKSFRPEDTEGIRFVNLFYIKILPMLKQIYCLEYFNFTLYFILSL